MSVLDRAIIKAFQRRRDSEAVARAAAKERCAAEELPAMPVVESLVSSVNSRAATDPGSAVNFLPLDSTLIQPAPSQPEMVANTVDLISDARAINSVPQRMESTVLPPLSHNERSVTDAIGSTIALPPVPSQPLSENSVVPSEVPPQRPEPESQAPVVHVQSAPASNGRASYTATFTRTSEPAPYVDNLAVKSPTPSLGYAVTEMSAVAPPPLPAVIERPVPQQWKWPEICEQLDQFTGEGFRQLAKHLQFAAEQGHKTLAFVSSAPGAGRTSVLLTLTRILALEGKTDVLLIDADRRHPQLASLITPQPTTGLREVLHGQLRMEQAVIPMNPGRVAVLPLNENLTDGEWSKLVAPMRVLLKQCRRDYDMILIDAGVLGPETRLADCWLRGAADAVITISRQLTGKRTEHEVLDWKQIGIESLGVIETFA